MLADAAACKDPLDGREQSNAETFARLAERYLNEHASLKKKPASVVEDRRMIERVLLPKLGQTKIVDITFQDVARIHGALSSTPYKANRVVSLVSKMFSLAEKWGLRERGSNPCVGIEKFREEKRERFLTTVELNNLGKILSHSAAHEIHPSSVMIIRLLLMTGARRGEVEKLRWDEVDLERRVLLKRDSKTGRREIKLSVPAAELLSDWPKHGRSEFVFPAARGTRHYQGLTKNWLKVRGLADLDGVRIHDLRHTFASITVSSGASLEIVGKLLGHTSPSTTARYAHLSDDPVAKALQRTNEILAEQIS